MLKKIQQRAVRMVSGLKSNTYKAKLKKLDMLSLEDRRILYDQVQNFKIISGFDAVNRDTWLTLVGPNPGRVTRHTSDPLNIVRQQGRTETRRSFFSLRVVDTWNSLPSEVKHTNSVASFRHQVRTIIKNKTI